MSSLREFNQAVVKAKDLYASRVAEAHESFLLSLASAMAGLIDGEDAVDYEAPTSKPGLFSRGVMIDGQ